MTGSHANAPTGRRPGRSRAWRVAVPVVAVLSGGLLSVSAVNSEGTDLRPGRYTDLAEMVQGEADDFHDLEDHFKDLSAEVDRLGGDVSDTKVSRTRARIRALSDPAGLTPRRGEGLRITLSDSPDDLLYEAVKTKKYKTSRYVVHQQDIQAVVNALWSGGATAVTIAGQRVISTTGINCEGNAVQLQGVPYPQPYVIEAVGDEDDLLAAIDADPLVSGFRADSANPEIGIGWSMETDDDISAPAFDGVIGLEYAKPLS